jgi:hypothetical protein
VDVSIGNDYELDLSGETIPGRGHLLIVDNDANSGPFGNVIDATNPVPHISCETLVYMRQGSTQLELQDPDGTTVMKVSVDKTGESDGDSTPSPPYNYSLQVSDPRPCWMRGGSAVSDNSPSYVAPDDTGIATYSDWQDGTRGTGTEWAWFNKTWRASSGAQAINLGDGYYGVYASDLSTVPPADTDNLLASFPPVAADTAIYTGVDLDHTKIMNNGILPSPGAIGYVHAGIPWGTVSLTNPSPPEVIGADSVVYLRNFTDYIVAPVSPYENGVDDDGDIVPDDSGIYDSRFSKPSDDRFGPEIRQRGKINVNTAPPTVLEALLKDDILDAPWYSGKSASEIASAIEDKRMNGPFSSVDDFFSRVPELFGSDGNSDSLGIPNSPRREALARFMYNLVTVRTDVWGVVAKVGLKDKGSDKIIASKKFYLVIDRSFNPPRIILRKQVEE